MPRPLELSDDTVALVRIAAGQDGVSADELVRRAVLAWMDPGEAEGAPDAVVPDAWQPLPVYGVYREERVEAEFLPQTRRLRIRTGALAGTTFRSPSGAARAVIAAVNPDRGAVHVNGWRFWRVAETHGLLASTPLAELRAAWERGPLHESASGGLQRKLEPGLRVESLG